MKAINHECYVSLEVAKLLKEAGFDWVCREYYYNFTTTGWSLSFDDNFVNWNSWSEQYISAPTLDVAQKWLREVHKVHILIDCIAAKRWEITLQYFNGNDIKIEDNEFTYEEAKEEGIKKCLTILLEEKK